MSVTDGYLSISSIDINTITNLQATLDDKATISQINTLQGTLNGFVVEVNEHLEDLDARLTWQKIGN